MSEEKLMIFRRRSRVQNPVTARRRTVIVQGVVAVVAVGITAELVLQAMRVA